MDLLIKESKNVIKRRNRFLVTLPKEFNIPEWYVNKCTTPKVVNFGKITIDLRVPIIEENYKKPIKDFDIKIEYLDECGCVIGGYSLTKCNIEKITVNDLDYGDDNLVMSKIDISYRICVPDDDIVRIGSCDCFG